MDYLHLSIDGKSACSGEPLDPEHTSDSPECNGMAVCQTCHMLQGHFIRERALAKERPCG